MAGKLVKLSFPVLYLEGEAVVLAYKEGLFVFGHT